MKFELPLKPLSVNQAWQGRRFRSQAYKQYERDVLALLPRGIFAKPLDGIIEVRYKFHLKNHVRYDVDNPAKCLTDILVTGGFIKNDRQIYRMILEKCKGAEDKIEVWIGPIGEPKGLV